VFQIEVFVSEFGAVNLFSKKRSEQLLEREEWKDTQKKERKKNKRPILLQFHFLWWSRRLGTWNWE
jgi:hypothetical protein